MIPFVSSRLVVQYTNRMIKTAFFTKILKNKMIVEKMNKERILSEVIEKLLFLNTCKVRLLRRHRKRDKA